MQTDGERRTESQAANRWTKTHEAVERATAPPLREGQSLGQFVSVSMFQKIRLRPESGDAGGEMMVGPRPTPS